MVIYKTTNIINSKIYVGKDSKNNPNYLGSGKLLRLAILKYGKENFKKEILENCQSISELDKREKFWIEKLKSRDRNIGYNLAEGGTGGDVGFSLKSEEEQKIIYSKMRNGQIKHIQKPEVREAMRQRAIKMWENENFRSKMSSILKGREITWKEKISESVKQGLRTGKFKPAKVSTERRKQISERSKGKELKSFPESLELEILNNYKENGANKIHKMLCEKGVNISPYLIKRILAKHGIYKKFAKGLKIRNEKRQVNVYLIKYKNEIFKIVNLAKFCLVKNIKIKTVVVLDRKVEYYIIPSSLADERRRLKKHLLIYYDDFVKGLEAFKV